MEFTEAQKRVYGPYPRGDGTEAYADPLLVRRHLRALCGGDLDRLTDELNGDNADLRHQATLQACWAVCEAFGLPHFDNATGQGTTADAALALLTDFILWVDAQKKSGATTSASSTGESPSSPPTPPPTS